ncbi:MAG TPA: hypothetical protein VFX49_12600 [Chloroflexota bacterium]|nr:hypothetical protein [Chloroflexota bacterium]
MAAISQLPVIQQVGAAPGTGAAPSHVQPGEDRPDWGAARCLIAATATAGLVGVPLGLHLAYWMLSGRMAEVPWVAWVQAHGQLQIFGWLGLSILGVTFHAMAHLFGTAEASNRLAWSVLILQLSGVALRFFAPIVVRGDAALRPWNAGAWLLLASALALLAAFAITLEAHVRTLPRRGGGGRAPAVLPRYLLSGLVLWLVALLVNLDGAVDALRFGSPSAGAISPDRDALVVIAAGGGMALIALGMSLRVVVGWLDLPPPDLRRASRAWLPLLIGTVLRVASAATGDPPTLQALAAVVWAAGVLFYLPALRGLWSAGAVTVGGGRRGEADPPLAWFVRTAYAGLLAAALLAAAEVWAVLVGDIGPLSPHALADGGRHALLFGYLGVLTAGLSGRLPTAFLDLGDRGVAATRLAYRVTWLLILPAAVLRVAGPLAGDIRAPLIAVAGVLGTAAFCSLLWALVTLARQRAALARARRLSGAAA